VVSGFVKADGDDARGGLRLTGRALGDDRLGRLERVMLAQILAGRGGEGQGQRDGLACRYRRRARADDDRFGLLAVLGRCGAGAVEQCGQGLLRRGGRRVLSLAEGERRGGVRRGRRAGQQL